MAKVFSIVDFKEGLDVRKTPLTAPGGSLRIMENAVINQGGEIEKRLAFVPMTNLGLVGAPGKPPVFYMIGYGGALHVFSDIAGVTIPPGSLPVPAVYHQLNPIPEELVEILDVEPYADKFFVCGQGLSGTTYCWYDGNTVTEADGSYSHGRYARTWKTKMYRLDRQYLRFSGVNNPAQNDPASVTEPGAGFINLALNDPEGEQLFGMEVYYAQMAIFAQLQTQLWALDPDPSKDNLAQVIRIGTGSPHSILQFGTGDVLFLANSGVRSLRSTTFATTVASVSDVGSAIDPLLVETVRADLGAAYRAKSVLQPLQGRYWMSIGSTIYVLSYFPAGKVTAWSTFDPGFTVQNFALVGDQVYVLDNNQNVYLYGGLDSKTYDTSKVTIRTPHLSADRPTENKRIQSVDVMCVGGPWTVQIGMLPNNTEAFELVATIQDNTFGLKSIPFAGYGTHFGVHLEHQAPGPAVLAALHLNLQEGVVK